MVELLATFFIKNRQNTSDPVVRRQYGILSGAVGIFLNLCLFAIKAIAGAISGSISITADAFNNLSDAGSSLITVFGFKLSGKKPDPEHPFGHGRVEYICGFAVSILIFMMGIELLKTSVGKIRAPEPVESGAAVIVILAVAIIGKLYMFFYNRRLGKKLSSAAMVATSTDSLCDCISTVVVLIATVAGRFTSFNIDAWCGLLVSLLILWAGFNAAKDTLSPLLGRPPEPELVADIEKIVMASPNVLGIHDLVVHDYGPGRLMISLHAEVPGDGDMWVLHDEMDLLEKTLCADLGCQAVIHMDPIAANDELVSSYRKELTAIVHGINPEISVHDFRMVAGPSHTNLIFDAVVPHNSKLSDGETRRLICEKVADRWGENHFCVITVDKPYV